MDGSASAGGNFAVTTVSAMPLRMVSNSGIGKRLLTVAEAAGYLGLQVDTVYKKARLRELPSVKVGRALRFDVKALERFVEQHTIETID
jgi:excisionase family DNA binding protein